MQAAGMLGPVLAMVAITFLVWLRMGTMRIGEMRRRRIHPQSVAGSAAKVTAFQDTRASDNFVNLFEMPVLFHVAALLEIFGGLVTPVSLGLAWTYVGLRAVHSLVQCSYNKVTHRFTVYTISCVVLLALWIHLAASAAW